MEPALPSFADLAHDVHETTQTGHGRTETRIVHGVALPPDFPGRADWKDLRTLVVVTSCRTVQGVESWESRHYITDHRPRAKFLGSVIRSHWSIENSQTADACCDVPAEDVVEVLDVLHVAGYVWRAAKAFYPHREHQEAFARDRLLRILCGDAKGVVSGLRRMATQRGLSGAARKEIDTICGYFAAHLDRMQYHAYLAAGYPIATGVIEGACRHLVKDRLERSGMRWTLAGSQAMLNLRTLRQSSYWDEFHSQRASPHAAAETLTG